MQAINTRRMVDLRAGVAAILAVTIFTAGIALGSLAGANRQAVGGAITVPLNDRAYDAVERIRADRVLSVTVGDHSYDAVERIRSGPGLSVSVGDYGYDASGR